MRENFKIGLVLFTGLILLVSNSFAQKDCPSIPVKSSFDTLGYIRANIPTSTRNPEGKLYLGQGWIEKPTLPGQIRPGFIPTNRPSWAIAIAVAWNYARNIAQRVEYPPMSYWMATLIQETELRCVPDLTWSDPSHVPEAYNNTTVTAAMINGGCLQIEGPGSGWGQVQQGNPFGRFPDDLYSQVVQGPDGFEGSAMVKTYYDAFTSQVFNYNVGWDLYKNVDCNMKNHDPFSYLKISASAYNGGHNGFLNAKGEIYSSGCWGNLPATFANYGNEVAMWASVLEQETSYCEYPTPPGNKFDSYFNDAVPWSEVERYLTIIKKLYPDVDFNAKLIPEAKAAFIAGAGSLSGGLNFMDFGNVIDAIVLNLPMEKPTPVEGAPIGVNLTCPGNELPYGHADILDGATNMCLGKSVTLELMVDAGDGPDVTYKWFKGDAVSGTLIGEEKIITITPDQVGTQVYAGQICNQHGCYTIYSNTQNPCQDPRNLNGFNVITRECSNCPFTASAVSTKSTCKGMTDGTVTVTLKNVPANYKVEITANTPLGVTSTNSTGSGATLELPAVRDGSYNFVFTDESDPDCQAYTSVIVGYDTEINEYVDGKMLSASNCIADVEAVIKELPAPCNWRVVTYSVPTFQWERTVNAGVKTSTGVSTLGKNNKDIPKGVIDDWNPVQANEQQFSLSTGDVMEFFTAVTTTPGATQWYEYKFHVYDKNDNLVHTASSPINGATVTAPFNAGSYTVTCPDNVPDYTFTWNPSIDNQTDTKVKSEGKAKQGDSDIKYVVTAINANNPKCTITDTVVVTGDPACDPVTDCTKPTYVLETGDTAICAGDTGKVRITLTGEAPFNVYYTSGGGTKKDTAVGVSENTYAMLVWLAGEFQIDSITDKTCSNDDVKKITITENELPVVSLGKDSIHCGDSLVLDAGSHTSYEWNDDALINSQNFSAKNTNATDYWVKITNDKGCIASDTVKVTINTKPKAVDLEDKTLCAASLPYELDATVSGVTYLWNDDSTDPKLSATKEGDYWVIITENNCSDTDSVKITVSGAGLIDLGRDTTYCGDSLMLDTKDEYVSYSWNKSLTDIEKTFWVKTSGEYHVVASNAEGCVASDTINVTINPVPNFAFSPTDTISFCVGNPVEIDATTDNATYKWNDGSSDPKLSTSTQGDYWVLVTVNGCSDSDSVYVKESTTLDLDLGPDTTVCPGQTVTLTPTVNYPNITYSWNGEAGSTTKTSLELAIAGKVYLDISDPGGCAGVDTMNFNVDNPLSISLGMDRDTCRGDSFTLELKPPRSGLNYSWDSGELDSVLIVKTSATYTLNVDSAGCTASDDVVITITELPTVDLGKDTTLCVGAGGSIDLKAGSNITSFLWDDMSDGPTRTVTTGGKYYVGGTDDNGCVGSDTIVVETKEASAFNLGKDTIICPAGKATIAVPQNLQNPNVSWEWTNDNSFTLNYIVENKAHGDEVEVELKYTNEFKCESSDKILVQINNNLEIPGLKDTAICEGASIELTTGYSGSGYTFQWSDGSLSTTPTISITNAKISDATTIGVAVQSSEGCAGTKEITFGVNALPTPLLKDTAVCEGTSLTLDHGATGNSVWSSGELTSTIQVTNGGTYVVTVIDPSTLCQNTAQSVVTVVSPPSVSLGGDQSVCIGAQIVINDGYDETSYLHSWTMGATNNSAEVTAVGTGSYAAAVTEISTGCVGRDTIDLTFVTGPTVDLGNDIDICEGQDTVIESNELNSAYRYQWYYVNDGVNTRLDDEVRMTVKKSGGYWLEVDNGSCKDSNLVNVNVHPLPISLLMGDTVVCFEDMLGGAMLLDPARVGVGFLWNTGDTTQVLSVNKRGVYSVKITDQIGCSVIDEVSVQEDCMANVWVPSSFTPNGDFNNDTWGVYGRGVESMEVQVFNRWGELLWTGTSTQDRWDGTFNSLLVGQDVYVWKLVYSYNVPEGGTKSRQKVGTLLLAR